MTPTRSNASLVDRHHGLRALCEALDADLCVWPRDSGDVTTTVDRAKPLLVEVTEMLSDAAGESLRTVIAGRAALGQRVVLTIGPAAARHLSLLVPGTWAAAEMMTSIDPDDPIVDRPLVTAVTADGLMLEMPDAVAIHGIGEPVAMVADGPHRECVVAVSAPLTRGTVTIIGSAAMLDDHWLLDADNPTFLTHALDPHDAATGFPTAGFPTTGFPTTGFPTAGFPTTGSRGAPMRAATVIPRPQHHHERPPVVAASANWLPRHEVPDALVAVDSPVFMRAARRASRHLPFDVWDAIGDFVDAPSAAGALLITGLPIGDVPPTPDDPTMPTTKDHTSELVLLAVARMLGQPVGYRPEHGGQLVQNLSPTRSGAARQTSTSSAVPLMFHTEAAFHRHRPRFLALMCLRGDPGASTTLASIDEVLGALPLGVQRMLFEPRFRMAADESYVGRRSHRLGRPMPVLHGDPSHPTMLFDADLMIGIDTEAHDALIALSAAVEEQHVSLVLATGDLLIIDNDRAVHGRSPFVPRYDGTDRWLQRTFVVSDLGPSAAERSGRVITTAFGT